MYKKILRDALLFPDEISPSARSILTGLLTRDLAKSQGVNCGGYVLREDHLLPYDTHDPFGCFVRPSVQAAAAAAATASSDSPKTSQPPSTQPL
jgi:serum/glucocorticoid-regulated kinase 2